MTEFADPVHVELVVVAYRRKFPVGFVKGLGVRFFVEGSLELPARFSYLTCLHKSLGFLVASSRPISP